MRRYRQHYRFMENKRMYNQAMNDRLDFVESGFSTQPSFKIERGKNLIILVEGSFYHNFE